MNTRPMMDFLSDLATNNSLDWMHTQSPTEASSHKSRTS